jgi:uncharacterized protein (DUF1778 family)
VSGRQALCNAAIKIVRRADTVLMAEADFDRMMAALDTADDSPQLPDLG